MKTLDDLKPENPQQGFQFPGVFEIVVLGAADAALESRIPSILAELGLSVLAGMHSRTSSEGRYLSLTLSFACPSREKYDATHAALRADPAVRWTI